MHGNSKRKYPNKFQILYFIFQISLRASTTFQGVTDLSIHTTTSYIRFATLLSQIPSSEGDLPRLSNTLANYTLSKPSSMAILVRSLTCPDRVFPFSTTTNNNGKSSLATQDYTSLASSLADSYYVLSVL